MDSLGDSYSIRETVRNDRKSHRNGIHAVVLPYLNGSYDYAMTSNNCCTSSCITYHNNWMFTIIKGNMINRKNSTTNECDKKLLFGMENLARFQW